MSKPTLPEVVPAFHAYRERVGSSWGSLHIVLADGNVSDGSVRFCIGWAEERGDAEGAALARVLLSLSRTQRGKLDWAVHVYAGEAV